MNFRPGRRFIALIACLAMIAAGFMPSLSYALAAQDSAAQPDLHEFCTARPAQQASHAPHAPRHGPTHGAHGAHCPLCLLHLGAAAPPPSSAAVIPVRSVFRLLAPAFLHAPRSFHVWIAAQPRAPPAIA